MLRAVICARAGSQRLKNKNIKPLMGKPLILHTIEFAKKHAFINEIIVNSDSNSILDIAKNSGCQTYERSKLLGSGKIFVVDVIKSMLRDLCIFDGNLVILFPTVPMRTDEDFRKAHKIFVGSDFKQQVISISQAAYPYQVSLKLENGKASPVFPSEYNNSTRHTDYNKVYHANYAFVFSSVSVLLQTKTLIQKGALTVETSPISSIDIDNDFHFELANALMVWRNKIENINK